MPRLMSSKKTAIYADVPASPDLPTLEQAALALWEKEQAFTRSIAARPAQAPDGSNNEWIFYDGPPFANGLPHYGHLLTSCVKDIFARYHTMRGKRVERRFGWDCHGLPAEMEAEKELGVSGRKAIEAFGIAEFNAHCRSSVMKYTDVWQNYVNRAARWVDFDNDYKTMDTDYMESVLWAFKQLYDKGLLYESHRVMPYSWAAETPLSNFETRMDDAYREVVDKAVTVAFELEEAPKGAPEAETYHLLAWTTTPWTLPSNLALAVSGEMEYVCAVRDANPPPLAGGVGGGVYTTRDPEALEKAKELRKNLSKAEAKLWSVLKTGQLEGYKFRKQQPVGPFIVDFICNQKRLVIELDGGQHAEQQEYDTKRTAFLEQAGYTVLRFWNNEVLENPEGVVEVVLGKLKELPDAKGEESSFLTPPPTPPAGGGGEGICYILAKSSVGAYAKELGLEEGAELPVVPGDALVGLSYTPLFPYFKDQPNAFRVLAGDFIEEGEGTGVVHLAPGFGEDDQRVCEEAGIGIVCPVDEAGKFTEAVPDFAGVQVFEANKAIIIKLKEQGQHLKTEEYRHNYPHCWRTDTPLIYKAVPSWYVAVTQFKERMVALNQNITWIPAHIKDGQFGKWLENARDWSISRNRFWGCPIPIWRSDNPENDQLYVFGSIAELEAFFGVTVEDLHRPFIDTLTAPDPENPEYTLRRVSDVLDCWFESGAMPFAQVHYPFENKDWFESHFPADFIVEYVGQTRGWFYTLMVLATALFDREPFTHCICHGIILDAEGKKLSKKLRNYPDPQEMFDQYGADAMRWRMVSEPIMQGGNLLIAKDGSDIRDVVRLSMKPLWNAYHFFTLYANADGVKAHDLLASDGKAEEVMDRYILAKLGAAVEEIAAAMDAFDTPAACGAVEAFFEVLNNWYIRRTRERFWCEVQGEVDADKQAAYDTLYTCLLAMTKAAAPLLPLLTETIWQGLAAGEHASVHLADFPDVTALAREEELVAVMDRVRDVCATALSLRSAAGHRIRQPLACLTLYGADAEALSPFTALIQEEVNVKEIALSAALEEVAEKKLQIHFPVCGKRLGPQMKQVAAAAKQGAWEYREEDGQARIEIAGEVLAPEEFTLQLTPKDGVAGAQAVSTQDMLVVLDTELTESLKQEGLARDLIRLIQQARKDADLHISDRITLALDVPEGLASAVKTHQQYIEEQTLSTLSLAAPKGYAHTAEHALEGASVRFGFSLAA